MSRAVGVELTPAHVRILSVEGAGKKVKVLQFQQSPIPAGEGPWVERAAAALRDACAEAKIPKGRVIAAIDSGEAILREVSLPFKGEEQIRKTVRFEMESLIHNYTIEQLVVSHYKTGEFDKGSHILAAAVPKTAIEKRLKLHQAAGVDPVALDLDVAAVFNAMRYAGAIVTDEPVLLVHGTPRFTKLVFIEEKQPRSIRTIRFSMDGSVPQAAESEADPAGGAEGENIPVVLIPEKGAEGPALDPQNALIAILAKEISRFLLANASSASPAHIILSGDFEEESAARLLESATRIPVKTFRLLEAVDPEFPSSGISGRVAAPLGLALKGLGIDALGMDFRQDEFQYTKKFEAIKTTALVTVELIIVLLAALGVHFYLKKESLDKSVARLLAAQQTLFENVSGESVANPESAYPKMDELYKKALASTGQDLPIKSSAREAWRDLFNALQKLQQKFGDKTLSEGTFFLEIDTIDIQQNTTPGNESLMLTMRGKIRNLEFAGHLKNELRSTDLFANADWVGAFQSVDDKVQFTIKAQKGGRQG